MKIMLVRVEITNTPLSRRTVRFMIKASLILALVQFFGLVSLYAVAAYLLAGRLNARRNNVQFTYKKQRPYKKKTT